MSADQASLAEFGADPFTDAEREVWDKVENGPYGVREYARVTGRAPGTVGNLLARARSKKEGR